MKVPVTLQHIANEAKVSRQTVSHILGNRAHLFRPETVNLVRSTAERLGYRPHSGAKAIRTGQFGAVGWISNERRSHNVISQGLIEGVHDALEKKGLHLVMGIHRDRHLNDEKSLPKLLRSWMTDGFLVTYTHDIPEAFLDALRKTRTPAVWLNSDLPQDVVRPDDEGAARMAVDYAISKGHTRIAYCDWLHDNHQVYESVDHYSIVHRRAGYESCMLHHGLKPQIVVAPWTATEACPFNAPIQTEILEGDNAPTAIILYSRYGAARLWEKAVALRKPLDLIVFDYAPFALDDIPITTMVLPEYEMGVAAVEMLVEKINKPLAEHPPRLIPLTLVSAESVQLKRNRVMEDINNKGNL